MNVELWENFYIRSDFGDKDKDIIKNSFDYPIFKSGQSTWPHSEWENSDFDPKVVVDIGGCLGSFSVMCKSLWPDCYTLIIEPNKENIELCKKNMLLHVKEEDESWQIYDAALNYYPDKVNFLKSLKSSGRGYLSDIIPSLNCEHYVLQDNSTFSNMELNQIVDLCPDNRIDILKLDCEGGENGLMNSLDIEILKDIPYIVGEWHGYEYVNRPPSPYCNSRFVNCLTDVLKDTHHVIAYDPSEGDHIGNFWCHRK